jgi:hypothetical protein
VAAKEVGGKRIRLLSVGVVDCQDRRHIPFPASRRTRDEMLTEDRAIYEIAYIVAYMQPS